MLNHKFSDNRVKFSLVIRILITLLPNSICADNLDILDSINRQLGKTKDSLAFDKILSSANSLININNDSSIVYAKSALNIAKAEKKLKQQISAEILIAKVYYTKGDFNSAIEQIDKAYQHALSINDSVHFIDVFQNYSLIYSKLGDFRKALDFSQQAFTLVGKLNQHEKLAGLARETGNIYFSFGESTIALDFYQKSLTLCREKNDEEGMSKALNNIGRIYSENKQFSKALDYLNQSLRIKEKHENKLGIANTLLNIGTIYLQLENYPVAIDYFKRSNSNYSSVSFNEGISNSLQYLGKTYTHQNNYHEAEIAYDKAQEIAEKNNLKPILFTITLGQSELYAKMKNFEKAYTKFLTYKEIRDSIYSDERRNLLMELDAKYRLQSKERQIQLLSKDQELKDAQRKKLL